MGLFNFQPDLTNKDLVLGNQIEYQHWEAMELTGYPVKFIKAVEVSSNPIFNESTGRSFLLENGYTMRCKRTDDSVYAGGEVFGGFGFTPNYNDSIYIAVKYFNDIGLVPEEQDLVFDDVQNIVYQITKVDTLLEAQQSLRINDRMFSYRIYLKHYTYGYKDNVEPALASELFEPELNDDMLADMNSHLVDAIADMDVLDETRIDEIFGDLR